MLDGGVDRAERPSGCGQDVRIAVAWAGAGDQAVELKPVQALPGEAVVQSCLFGDVDEPHGPTRVEDLDHGGRVAKVQPAHGVLDALGTGHLAERQVRVGPVGQCPVYCGQCVAEPTELVRGTVAITGSDH
ncbi:hypothetical protein [Streptomyces sp. NPDC002588]|uniref:hypothetical protein n=1 Tax=Streptomyces sp. NPDC002588 TaxID=3154419 RepID=UPI0033310755